MKLADSLWLDLCGHAQGRDCWALVAEIFRRRGVALVGFDADRFDDWREVSAPEPGDVVLTVRDGRSHVGVIVGDGRYVHAAQDRVAVSRLAALRRAGVGYRVLRHAGVVAAPDAAPVSPGVVRVVYVPDPVGAPLDRQSWLRVAGTYGELAPPGANAVMVDGAPRVLAEVAHLRPEASAVYATVPAGTEVVIAAIGLLLSVASAVIGLLTAPKTTPIREDDPYSTFDGIRNTAASGIVQPVAYGAHRVAGNFISAAQKIDAQGRAVFYGLLLLSRGPVQSIAGLTADADEITGPAIPDAIKIDDNPARNYDAKVSVRLGGSEQTPVPGFSETASTFSIGASVDQPSAPADWPNAIPWGYTTTQAVTGFDVLLTYPGGLIGYSTSNQNPYAITMQYEVKYRVNGTTTWTTETWSHSAQRNAQVSFQFSKRGLTRDVYEVQVRFVAAPGIAALAASDVVTASQVLAVNEIVAQGFAYPGCALLGVRLVGSDQLAGGVPTITTEIEGRKVWVWDGVSTTSPAFTQTYTRNPAWIVVDLLTSKDYGLGRGGRITLDAIDLAAFDDFADWCDELVDDGRGGTVPRAQCDHVAAEESGGWDLAQSIVASAFGKLYYAGGKVRVWIDGESDPVFLFTAGNTRDVKIQYAGRRSRPNAAEVQYLNAETNYESDYATKLDDSAVLASGEAIRKNSVGGVGITRAAQAYRLAQRLVNEARYVGRRVEWVSGPEAIHLQPGDVVSLHGSALGSGVGGRVLAAASGTITLDRTFTATARVRIVVGNQADGLETKYIAAGSYARGAAISIVDSGGSAATWTTTPTAGAKWVIPALGSQATEPMAVRIERMAAGADLDVSFAGSEYVAAVYDDDPGDVEEFTDTLPSGRAMPESVANLAAVGVGDAIRVSFDPTNQWDAAEVWYRSTDGAADGWVFHGWSRGEALIPAVVDGAYEVAVAARSPAGTRQRLADAARAFCHVRGLRTAPDAPTAVLAAVTAAGILTLTITPPDDASVAGYEIRHGLRLVAETAGPEWSGPCPFTGAGTLSVRSVNALGVTSDTAVSVAVTWTLAPSVFTTDIDVDEDTAWAGDLDDLSVTGTELEITGSALTGTYTQDDQTPTNTTDPQQVVITAVTDLADVAMTWDEAGFTWGGALGSTLTWATSYLSGREVTELDSPTWAQAGWTWDGLQASLRTWAGPTDVAAALEPDLAYDDDADLTFTAYPGPFVAASVSTMAARVTLNRPHSRYEPRLVSLNLTTLDLSDAGGGGAPWDFDGGDATTVHGTGTIDLDGGDAT